MKARARETESDRAMIREEARRIGESSAVSFEDALDLVLIRNLRRRWDDEEVVAGLFEFEREVHARDRMREVVRNIFAILEARTEAGIRITPTTDMTEIAGQTIWAPVELDRGSHRKVVRAIREILEDPGGDRHAPVVC